MVARSAAQDGSGKSEDAQFGDLETSRCRVEAFERVGETSVHRRSEATARRTHEGAPGLQVSAAT